MPRQDYDKIVKLACKPKNAPPKAKVGISAAECADNSTWSESDKAATRDGTHAAVTDASISHPSPPPPNQTITDSSALIAGTFDEHALQDITRSLSMRVRDSNPVVRTLGWWRGAM